MTDDAITIVGAGPAGLGAALAVAARGGRAVVLERTATVGGRFHGDFQGLENWTTPGDVLDELAALGIAPDLGTAPFHEVVLFDPDGREHRCRSEAPLFHLVRRGPGPGTLDSLLLQQALARGVEVRFRQAPATLPEPGIVATGPAGHDALAVGYAFTTEMADGAWAVFSDALAPRGYGYLLVSRGRGTVASCLFADFERREEALERCLLFFERAAGLRMTGAQRIGGVGSCLGLPRPRTGGTLRAGEAAGFQDALFGFGIRSALVSGALAATALLDGAPAAYDDLVRARLGGLLRAALVNRFLFARGGHLGYRWIARQLARAPDARAWLRRFYAPSWRTTCAYPLVRLLTRRPRPVEAGPVVARGTGGPRQPV